MTPTYCRTELRQPHHCLLPSNAFNASSQRQSKWHITGDSSITVPFCRRISLGSVSGLRTPRKSRGWLPSSSCFLCQPQLRLPEAISQTLKWSFCTAASSGLEAHLVLLPSAPLLLTSKVLTSVQPLLTAWRRRKQERGSTPSLRCNVNVGIVTQQQLTHPRSISLQQQATMVHIGAFTQQHTTASRCLRTDYHCPQHPR